jgi:hypothetical protein
MINFPAFRKVLGQPCLGTRNKCLSRSISGYFSHKLVCVFEVKLAWTLCGGQNLSSY